MNLPAPLTVTATVLTDEQLLMLQLMHLSPVVVSLILLATFSAHADDIAEKQQRLHNIQQQIEHTQQTLQQAEGQKGDVQTTLMAAEKEISYIGRRLHIIRKDYVLQQQRQQILQTEVEQKTSALQLEQQQLARLLRSAFQMDRHGDIRLLLNQQSPALFSRMLTYHDYFNRQRVRQIDKVKLRLQELSRVQQALSLQTRTLTRLQQKREQELAKLEQFKVQKQQVLTNITIDINSDSGLLSQLRKDENLLKSILKSLTELLSDIPLEAEKKQLFSLLRGKLNWPSAGRLTTHFGNARGDSGKHWSGVVIGIERGHDVKAVARGRVAFSDWLRGYGLLIIIDHGEDYMSLYGHNESVFKDTGEWVETGDIIASVGDSGGQKQTGLYFEIRKDGKPVNPVKWCKSSKPPAKG